MTDLKDQATKMASAVGDLLKGGGAAGILGKLKAHGLGDIGSSWVGLGKNLPISAEQLGKLLDNATIASIAGKLGLSPDRAKKSLAEALPHAIDDMTPDGAEPAHDAAPPDPVALARRIFGGGDATG